MRVSTPKHVAVGDGACWSCHVSCILAGCVWAVAFLSDGDLVTACSDGVARVWSTDPSRAADPQVLQVRRPVATQSHALVAL